MGADECKSGKYFSAVCWKKFCPARRMLQAWPQGNGQHRGSVPPAQSFQSPYRPQTIYTTLSSCFSPPLKLNWHLLIQKMPCFGGSSLAVGPPIHLLVTNLHLRLSQQVTLICSPQNVFSACTNTVSLSFLIKMLCACSPTCSARPQPRPCPPHAIFSSSLKGHGRTYLKSSELHPPSEQSSTLIYRDYLDMFITVTKFCESLYVMLM